MLPCYSCCPGHGLVRTTRWGSTRSNPRTAEFHAQTAYASRHSREARSRPGNARMSRGRSLRSRPRWGARPDPRSGSPSGRSAWEYGDPLDGCGAKLMATWANVIGLSRAPKRQTGATGPSSTTSPIYAWFPRMPDLVLGGPARPPRGNACAPRPADGSPCDVAPLARSLPAGSGQRRHRDVLLRFIPLRHEPGGHLGALNDAYSSRLASHPLRTM